MAEMLEVECADALALEGQLLEVSAGPWVLVVLEARLLILLKTLLLPEGTERGLFEVIETLANVTLEEVHPSFLLSADENGPLEEHDDYVADLKVLLFACLVVDLVDSFLLVEICHASNHPSVVTSGAVMESAPCSQTLALCSQVVSCQEGDLDGQVHQVHDCTLGEADVSQEDFESVACRWIENASGIYPPQKASLTIGAMIYLIGDLRLGGDLRLTGDRLSGGRGGLISQITLTCPVYL